MRISHLLPSSADSAAGLASAAGGLASAQGQQGHEIKLHAADTFPFGRRSAGLIAASSCCDVVHSHGLWLAPSAASGRLAARGMPVLIAPHGMLDPWAWRHHRGRKRLLWALRERHALQSARCLQALCSAERAAIQALGLRVPIALIPNGINMPDRSAAALAALPPPPWTHVIPAGAPVLLFLGRFHEKKGIQPLLAAWQQLQAAMPVGSERPSLVLAGFGDGGALARQLRQHPIQDVHCVGALHGSAKASAFSHAQGFVLPSLSEGLPMAALEAMSWGLPCLLSAACNLPEAFGCGAAWPASADVPQLLPVLRQWAGASPGQLSAMGAAGRQLAAQRFSWPAIASQTIALYSWLISGGAPPPELDLTLVP